MMQLQDLKLTEKDFQLLVDALDFLPEKGATGEIVGDLLMSMVTDNEPGRKEKMEAKMTEIKRKRIAEAAELKEDAKILAGKLLLFKRFLQQEGLLSKDVDQLDVKN